MTYLTKRVKIMTAPNRLKMRKNIEFHCSLSFEGWVSGPTMLIAEDMTSIHPSSETISNSIRMAFRNESKDQTVVEAVRPGFDHTLGVKKFKELSTGEFMNSPIQSALPAADPLLQVYSRPAKIFKL